MPHSRAPNSFWLKEEQSQDVDWTLQSDFVETSPTVDWGHSPDPMPSCSPVIMESSSSGLSACSTFPEWWHVAVDAGVRISAGVSLRPQSLLTLKGGESPLTRLVQRVSTFRVTSSA